MKVITWTQDGFYYIHGSKNLDCPVCNTDKLRIVLFRERVSDTGIKIENIDLECMNGHKYQVSVEDE